MREPPPERAVLADRLVLRGAAAERPVLRTTERAVLRAGARLALRVLIERPFALRVAPIERVVPRAIERDVLRAASIERDEPRAASIERSIERDVPRIAPIERDVRAVPIERDAPERARASSRVPARGLESALRAVPAIRGGVAREALRADPTLRLEPSATRRTASRLSANERTAPIVRSGDAEPRVT